jgi:ASC-1-like (ASCH) protein
MSLDPSVLHLNLHRKFFAQIAAGTKRVEYRDEKPYWRKRLVGRPYDVIQFRNGYATKAPEMLVEFRGVRRYGSGRNGYYAILLGRVLRLTRWKRRGFKRSRGI